MAIRVTGDGHIGLVMTGRPAKISILETFWNGLVTQSIPKKNVSRITGHH